MALLDYINPFTLGKRLRERSDRRARELASGRTDSIRRIDDAIATTEAEIERLNAVPELAPSDFTNPDSVRAYLAQVFPRNGASERLFEFYQRFMESEDASNPLLIQRIVEDFKDAPLYKHRNRLELLKRTRAHLDTSKDPRRDTDLLKQYFIAEDEYAQRLADCGGCGFAAGEGPRLPKYLR